MDVSRLGYPRAIVNAVVILVGLALVGLLIVAIDHLLTRMQRRVYVIPPS